jgi:hypothetical protein
MSEGPDMRKQSYLQELMRLTSRNIEIYLSLIQAAHTILNQKRPKSLIKDSLSLIISESVRISDIRDVNCCTMNTCGQKIEKQVFHGDPACISKPNNKETKRKI